MDCCVCTTMPLILRPPRNTICGACYEGVRSIINMMSNVESEKVKAMANPNPNSSPVSRRNSNELTIEEEAERKVGWLLKTIFFVTAGVAGYHFFPYMGENLMQQSVSLLRVKDPLFKRMGASRLARFAVDDERRKKIVEMGGAQELLNMLSTAKDDRTRKEALHALDALSQSDEALASLHHAGAISVIRSAPNSLEDAEVEGFKLSLMKRFQDLRYDVPS
ncbi:BTB/POZ domain-containing protein [Glycine soja]|nr:BTB/POZ domain-containing protein [Glycine soja]